MAKGFDNDRAIQVHRKTKQKETAAEMGSRKRCCIQMDLFLYIVSDALLQLYWFYISISCNTRDSHPLLRGLNPRNGGGVKKKIQIIQFSTLIRNHWDLENRGVNSTSPFLFGRGSPKLERIFEV